MSQNSLRRVGLRVDADTFHGTKNGIPHLLDRFASRGIRASFFFCVGPDNMGRHLWRLLKPAFLRKMFSSKAASLYGWHILLAGTAWPGRHITPALADLMRACADAGHEVGLHAWDHQGWQAHMGHWPMARIKKEMELGLTALEDALGCAVLCSAAPGWRANNRVLDVKQGFGFRYNSDCRGSGPFRPVLDNGGLGTVQVPVTLPTYDEVVGKEVDEDGYNEYILNAMENALQGSCPTPVYTIHTEVEGVSRRGLFDDFLLRAGQRTLTFCPLGELLPDDLETLPAESVVFLPFPGREGALGQQASLVYSS